MTHKKKPYERPRWDDPRNFIREMRADAEMRAAEFEGLARRCADLSIDNAVLRNALEDRDRVRLSDAALYGIALKQLNEVLAERKKCTCQTKPSSPGKKRTR